MKPTVTIREALTDPALLGNVLAGDSWQAWRVLMIASMGEPLTDDERTTFTKLTGREREPLQRVEELVGVIGRRGGKSRACAMLACYIAALCKHDLAAGERGVCLLVAPDQRQAAISLEYAQATLEGSPLLAPLIANRSGDTITLTTGIVIEVRAASFRRLRGPTYICCICDEVAFFMSEDSANPDVEILNAIRPGLATSRGPLIIASSPYAKRGALWEAHRKNYGPDGDPMILVAQGTSRQFNPSLPQSVVDRALERDHASASAEYLAMFRDDISSFVAFEIVEACVGDHVELAPLAGNNYHAFVDPSGGSADSFTMAISHNDAERVVVDAVREVRPPFSPEQVVDDFATLLKSYRVYQVVGDRYAGEWPREQFRKRGIQYDCAALPKSDLFRDLLPRLNAGSILLPRSDRLVMQLVGLERRTARSGRDSIDHSPGSHDDLANAVAGAASIATQPGRQAATGHLGGPAAAPVKSGLYAVRRSDGAVVLRQPERGLGPGESVMGPAENADIFLKPS